MRQNIYDDARFFAEYQRMRRTETGLNAVLEQPALRRLLPPVSGSAVVDLGCGCGELCRELAASGATNVLGIDPSANMLAEARAHLSPPTVRYRRMFMEDLHLPPSSVDLVVSSLALHYVADLHQLLANARDWLRPGGRVVASMEHPVMTAAPHRHGAASAGLVLSGYCDEGPRQTSWFVDGVVKYHRRVSTIVSAFLAAGLSLEHLDEPAPEASAVTARPELQAHRQRPPLLVVRAVKP